MTATAGSSWQDDRLVHREGALVGAAVSAVVLAVLAVLVDQRWAPLMDADRAIEDRVHAWALVTPWAVDVSELLSVVGGVLVSTVATLIVLVTLLLARRWWLALSFGLVASLAPFLTDVLKEVVERPRPVWSDPVALAPPADPWSFPSGHATGGIAVWLAAGIALSTLLSSSTARAWFVLPWWVLGIAIGVSRVVLGLHWTSDVVAGWCMAAAVAGVAAALLVLPSRDIAGRAAPRRPAAVRPESRRPVRGADPAADAAAAGAGGVLPAAVAQAAPPDAPAPGKDVDAS